MHEALCAARVSPSGRVAQLYVSPENVKARRLAEDETARRSRPLRVEAEAGQPREEPLGRGQRLEAGEVHADTDVRALRKGELELGVLALRVEAVRVGEGRGIAVRPRELDLDEVAFLDRRTGELDVPRCVAVDDSRRGLEAERFLQRVRRRFAAIRQEMPREVRDHALRRLHAA